MKVIYKIIGFFSAILISDHLFSQPVHTNNIVKQTQVINGILRATSNANSNVKLHANSNSVFGTSKTHPNYNNKDRPEKNEIKINKEREKNGKTKKQKK